MWCQINGVKEEIVIPSAVAYSFKNGLFSRIRDSFLGTESSDKQVINQYCQNTRDGDLCLIQVTQKWYLNNK